MNVHFDKLRLLKINLKILLKKIGVCGRTSSDRTMGSPPRAIARAITKFDIENYQLVVLEFWIFNVENLPLPSFRITLTLQNISPDYSSVGRAGDCRGSAVISRSLVRIRLVGSFFMYSDY